MSSTVAFPVPVVRGFVSVSVIVPSLTETLPPSTEMSVVVFWSSHSSTGVYAYVATLLSVPSAPAVSFALGRVISGTSTGTSGVVAGLIVTSIFSDVWITFPSASTTLTVNAIFVFSATLSFAPTSIPVSV